MSGVFDRGLLEIEFDAAVGGGPDFDLSCFLTGERMAVEVLVTPEQVEIVEAVSRIYYVSASEDGSTAFVQSLFNGYLSLSDSRLCATDEDFRLEVDSMLYVPFFDLPQDESEEGVF